MKTRKIASLVLALVMVFAFCISVFAGDTSNTITEQTTDGKGTSVVTYTGNAQQSYTVTVPATINVKAEGDAASDTVSVSGEWASNFHLKVTCDDTVTLTNNLDQTTKNLIVRFAGIDKSGDNTKTVTDSKTITVDNITGALFGTWTGTLNYTVTLAKVAAEPAE